MSGSDPSSQQSREKGGLTRFAELGPAWIASLATLIVALTGAGFFAGRVSASSSQSAQPPKTVTRTVTATPTSPQGASTSGTTSTTGNGTELGTYTFRLPSGYGAPLASTAPTQSEIAAAGGADDITWPTELAPLSVGNGDQMVGLPNGSTPTYSSCTGNTTLQNVASTNQGTAFCIIETSGRVAGVAVTSIVRSTNSYITLQVTVWTDVS